MIIEMKANEQHVPVVLFYAVQSGSNFLVRRLNRHSQIKANKKYFLMALFVFSNVYYETGN